MKFLDIFSNKKWDQDYYQKLFFLKKFNNIEKSVRSIFSWEICGRMEHCSNGYNLGLWAFVKTIYFESKLWGSYIKKHQNKNYSREVYGGKWNTVHSNSLNFEALAKDTKYSF